MTDKTIDAGLNEVFKIISKSALAEELGIRKQATSNWRRCPHERALEVEKITGVSRSVLRPDIWPPKEKAPKKRRSSHRR